MSLLSITQLLPHRPPMLLLDALVEHGDDWAVCEVWPKPDQLFATRGKIPALITIEYMAQAVGALAGLLHHNRGEPVCVGYLIGTRQLLLHVDEISVGQHLLVHVRNAWSGSDGRAGLFECKVESAGILLANAVLTVYEPPARGSSVT